MAVHLVPAAFAVLMPWAIYRRVRMHIGRQKLDPRRLKLRSVIMAALLVLLTAPALLTGRPDAAFGLAAGATLGVLIALLALRHTRFLEEGGQEFYVPHPYLGLALTSLLIGRMAWRYYVMLPAMEQTGGMPPMGLAAMSPLTLGLLGLILVYNTAFSVGLLRHIATRALPPQ